MTLRFLRVLSVLAAISTASAHECWLVPDDFTLAKGDSAVLRLKVGMNLAGEPRTFTPERVTRLRHHNAAGVIDLTRGATAEETWPVPLFTAGTHVFAFYSQPSLITIEAAKFNAYLTEEGLDTILAARAAAGTTDQPGRERYLRCNKTLVHVGDATDNAWNVSTEQRLEITPLSDPATLTAGADFSIRLRFDGEPVAGALVRAWHRDDAGELTLLPARTDAKGFARFTLPAAGMWMVSVVHMIALTGDAEADWESYWGNFTFALPSADVPN